MFIFVELFRFAGEQIGFQVLVFGLAGPDIEPGRCTFAIFLLVLESPDFNISKFFRHFCVTHVTRLFGDFGLP